jgi:tape measure domain-containing protein
VAQSTVKLIVDAQNAISPLKRVNEQTKILSSSTDKLKGRLDKSNRSLKNTGSSAKQASGGVKTLTGSLGPLLKALAAAAAIRFVFVKTAELETQRKSLEVLTGSLEKTNKIIAELQAFGAVTPFTSSELIEQSKRLKAFGFTTDELTDSVKRLSDIAGATGADLSGIATAFGQIRAKGKLQQEENLQLLERGVDITTELKRITGLQGEEFESAMRKGKIGADLVNQAFINLTNQGGAFFGGATAQADTLAGRFSTLVDSIETLARKIGQELTPEIKTVLNLGISAVNTISKLIDRFSTIGEIGVGVSTKAEMDARSQATRLTKMKFGDDIRLSGFAFTDEEKAAKKFLKEQTAILKEQFIEREKLKQKSFEEVEIIKEGNQKQTETTNKIIETKKIVEGTTTAAKALNDETKNIANSFAEIGNTIGSQISDALVGAINGTKSLGEAAKNIINDLANSLLRMGINTLLKSTGLGIFSNLIGFANGGRPPVGRPSIVGEKGPELFVPSSAGTIIPNNKIGGMSGPTNIVVNVDASGSNVEGNEDEGRQLGLVLSAAIESELIKQKRPGGLLA